METVKKHYNLGIIGTGKNLFSVGWQVASQLCIANSSIENLLLFNRTAKGAENLKDYLDNAVISQNDKTAKPSANVYEYLDDLIGAEPDIIFVSFEALPKEEIERYSLSGTNRKKSGDWKELVKAGIIKRKDFLLYNSIAMSNLAAHFQKGYKGKIIINTNPVDVMAYLFILRTGLNPEQVAGFNESDSARFRRILLETAKTGNPLIEMDDIEGFVIGPHNEHVVPVFSQAKICGEEFYGLSKKLPYFSSPEIKQKLIAESGKWFNMLGSTSPELAVTYAKTIEATALGNTSQGYFPVLSVYNSGFKLCMGWPVDLSNNAFKPRLITINHNEFSDLNIAVENTKKEIEEALKYMT